MQKIIQLVDQFAKLFGNFKNRFDEIGKTIEKLETVYSDVRNKNFKSLDTKIRHIDDYKKGKGIALPEPDEILLDATIEETVDDDAVV